MQNRRSAIPGFLVSNLCLCIHGKSVILPSSGPEMGPVSWHLVPLVQFMSLSQSGYLSLFLAGAKLRPTQDAMGTRGTARPTWLLWREQVNERGKHMLQSKREWALCYLVLCYLGLEKDQELFQSDQSTSQAFVDFCWVHLLTNLFPRSFRFHVPYTIQSFFKARLAGLHGHCLGSYCLCAYLSLFHSPISTTLSPPGTRWWVAPYMGKGKVVNPLGRTMMLSLGICEAAASWFSRLMLPSWLCLISVIMLIPFVFFL